MKNNLMKKPVPLRVIFILNAIMAVLPFVFYIVFMVKNIKIEGLNPIYMVYTGIAYIISFVALVYFILKKNKIGAAIVIAINFLIAFPASAFIGMLVAIISMLLLLLNKKVKAYFNS